MSSQGNVFARAVALQQAGDLEQSAGVYEQILRSDPQHAEAWHQLGLVVYRLGRPEQAAACLNRALALDGSNAAFHGDLGMVCQQLGRFDEALDALQQAVQLAPEDAQAQYSLGALLLQRGDHVGARLRFQQALRLRPDFAEAWNDLAITHQAAGQLEETGHCFEKLTELIPEMAGGHFNLGNVRLAQNRLLEAVAGYSRALELQPRFPEALGNLGVALHRLGKFEQARKAYQTAIALAPDFADAHNNLGALSSLLGRYREAEACYRASLRLDTRSSAARNNLAGVLQAQMQLEEAESLLREALAIDPESVQAPGNLANVLAQEGRIGEAADWYRQALARQPDARLRIQAALLLPPVYESIDEIQRSRNVLDARLKQLVAERVSLDSAREPVAVNFLLAYQGLNDRDLARRVAGLYRSSADSTDLTSSAPTIPAAPHFASPGTGAPIRIGFLSKFLRNHSIGDLTKGLIQELSRSDFHVTVFLVGDAEDETVAFLRQSAETFVNLPEDIASARSMVAAANLDVLVYPDIGMEPLSSTLAHSRLARVQCALWGHPVTTGLPSIDHFISSRLIEPADALAHYTENLVLLDSLPTYYYRPQLATGANGEAGPTPTGTLERETARREFGLSSVEHLYLSPQSLFKFHPDFDSLLAAILARDSAARLILLDAPHRHWTELLSNRLRRTLNGRYDRVSFVPRIDRATFLRLLTTADVVLDPIHFGGGNTSFQALGLGVPIVTLPSTFMRGRVTAGCYQQLGFEECVARNADDYVNIAVRLGMDREFNARVRAEIITRSAALFEDRAAVRELEEFFKSAIRGAAANDALSKRPADRSWASGGRA